MIEKRLARLVNNEKSTVYSGYTPDAVKGLAMLLGNPQDSIPAVHIAGTNGKGSVAHMLDSITGKAGLRTGLYTSPHLLRINERIRINGNEIQDNEMSACLDEIENAVTAEKGPAPTWFDVLTLIAFMHFSRQGVDIAIIEAGLGGRLDSTNILNPVCTVITDISLDHTGILGADLAAIASEKAGIIKRNTPLVTSNNEGPVFGVLEKRAVELDAESRVMGRDFQARGVRKYEQGLVFDFTTLRRGNETGLKDLALPLESPVQVRNASLAAETAIILKDHFPVIDTKSVREGLARVQIPGRMETLSKDPAVLYDPAHNPASFSALFSAMEQYSNMSITIIFTLMKDKDVQGIMRMIADSGFRAVYYNLDDPRAFHAETGHVPPLHGVADNIEELRDMIRSSPGAQDMYLFTGSTRLYKTARDFCEKQK